LPGAKEIADKWSGAFLVAGHQAAEHWRVDWREGRLTLLPPGELHDSGGDIRIGQRFDYLPEDSLVRLAARRLSVLRRQYLDTMKAARKSS
jgi:hypothetical protein